MYNFIKKLRSAVLVYLTHNMALPVLKLVRRTEKFPYTIEALRDFPQGTVGRDLAGFLDVNNLQLLPFYARHDIKHILLGYETTDEGEGSLQSFMLGNGHFSFPVLATVVYCFFTMPEHWQHFRTAFKRGRSTRPVSNWDWYGMLATETAQLQSLISK